MGVSDPKDRHSARLLMVSAGGAVVVAISLLYTARNYRLSHLGQVTDRFANALGRLSSGDIDARLGGIYTLTHVAKDSRPHRPERRTLNLRHLHLVRARLRDAALAAQGRVRVLRASVVPVVVH